MEKKHHPWKQSLILISLLLSVMPGVLAQMPTHYPTSNTDPIEFNFINILIFIVFPIVLIAGVITVRRRRRKKK